MVWSAGAPEGPKRTAIVLVTLLLVAGCGGSTHHQGSASSAGSATASASGANAAGAVTTAAKTASRSSTSAGGSGSTASTGATSEAASAGSTALPTGAIATVAGRPITLLAYRQAYGAETRDEAAAGVPLDPPAFTRCAAGLARQYSAFAKGLKKTHEHRPPTPSHATLIKECQERLRALAQGAVSQLIEQQWFERQAQAQGVQVSTSAAAAALAAQRRALGGAAAYGRYLRRIGETPQQAISRMRLDLLEQRIQQLRLGPSVSISDQQVSHYFTAHHAEFVLPGDKSPKLSQYSARIRLVLAEQVRAQRAAAAATAFERRWRAQTRCRAGYVVSSLCANGA